MGNAQIQYPGDVIPLRDFLNGVVLRTARPVSAMVGGLYTILLLMSLAFSSGYPNIGWMNLAVALMAAMFFWFYWLARRGRLNRDHVHPLAYVATMLSVGCTVLSVFLLDSGEGLLWLVFTAISYAAFPLSWFWMLLGVVSICGAGILTIVARAGFAATLPFWPYVIATVIIATTVFMVRRWGFLAAHEALEAVSEQSEQRRRTEMALAQSQRLESLGRLASGVAHDFNNLMMVVLGYAQTRLEATEDETARAELREIVRAGGSASELAQKMLAFSRQQELQPVVQSLNDSVTGAAGLIRKALPGNVELDIDLHEDAGLVEVDPVQMQQVLLNLAVNAADAMEDDGGRLRIRTAPTADAATLEVSDTGAGIPSEIRNHVFEPFFTTKAADRGTGLGLASVHGTVTQSGGTIELESEVGKGTTFRIALPRMPSSAAVQTGTGGTAP